MPLTPDPPPVLADALPRLAGPADPAERAQLLVAAARAVTGLGAAVVILADDGTVEAVAGSDAGCRRVADTGADTAGAAGAKGAPSGDDWERIAADQGWGPPCVVPMADDAAGPGRGGLGALVLLPAAGARVPPAQATRARTLAAVTVAALLQQRALVRERATARQLATALESRVVIEQAKGVLAERGGIDPDIAFDRLRRYARTHRQGLRDVARDVVRGTLADAVLGHAEPPRGTPGRA